MFRIPWGEPRVSDSSARRRHRAHATDDPDIRLVKLDPSAAEVWLTSGAVGFAFELVKSKLTGDQPDMGDHFTVTF